MCPKVVSIGRAWLALSQGDRAKSQRGEMTEENITRSAEGLPRCQRTAEEHISMMQLSLEISTTQTIYLTRLENSMLCCMANPKGRCVDPNSAQGFSAMLSEVSCFNSAERTSTDSNSSDKSKIQVEKTIFSCTGVIRTHHQMSMSVNTHTTHPHPHS